MIRCRVALLAAALSAALMPGRVGAQYFPQQQPYNPQFGSFNPQGQASFSPYLGMLTGNPAVNYYGATRGVIPSFQQNFLNSQFSTSLLDLQRRQVQGTIPTEEISLLPGTGHPTAFGYYYPYYGLNPGQRIAPQMTPQTFQGARRSARQ
jgi:hypothetical protein